VVPQISPQDLERWRNPDWRIRLAAWWEGYDLSRLPRVSHRADLRNLAELRQPGPVDAVGTATLPAASSDLATAGGNPELDRLALMQLDRHGEPVWSPARSEGAQLLWGQDMTGPEEAAWMVDSVRSFGLNPAKSVLDLSAGLGGTARALVESCDTWVTGLEPSPLLAKLAMDRSKALGLSKKAPIAHYDPEHFNQAGSFDLVMADRIVHRLRDKELFLDRVGGHERCNILFDPSHFVLQQLDYLGYIDVFHDRIPMFHVKDAEFNPTPWQGVYSGYAPWKDRAGRFRSLGDGQVDFRGIFSKLTQYGFDGWAVLEWECCIKHPEQGAAEGARFIQDHIIRVTDRAFDDFADAGTDEAANRRILGLGKGAA